MQRIALVVIAALLLVGCDDDEESVATPPPPSGPSVPTLGAASTTEEPPPEPWLVVAYHDVSMGEGEPIVTLEDRRVRIADRVGGEAGLLVRPLHERLTSTPTTAGPTGIAIDPEIPFRTVSEVVYTLGQAERTDLAFIVRSGEALAALPVAIPSLDRVVDRVDAMLLGALGGDDERAFADVLRGGVVTEDAEDVLAEAEGVGVASPSGSRAAPDYAIERPAAPTAPATSSLHLSLTVTARGVVVAGSGGFLAPGCEEIGRRSGVTVPLRAGLQDLAALASCLEKVHREFPEERAVTVSADPDIAFRDVAGAMATARGTRERPLFPEILISAGVR